MKLFTPAMYTLRGGEVEIDYSEKIGGWDVYMEVIGAWMYMAKDGLFTPDGSRALVFKTAEEAMEVYYCEHGRGKRTPFEVTKALFAGYEISKTGDVWEVRKRSGNGWKSVSDTGFVSSEEAEAWFCSSQGRA
jgi:hypothetical protein